MQPMPAQSVSSPDIEPDAAPDSQSVSDWPVARGSDAEGMPAASVVSARFTTSGAELAHAAGSDPYAMVRQALRGRYVAFVLLALLGAAGGAVGGWMIGRPTYRSTAEVRIAYAVPAVVDPDGDVNKWLAPYELLMKAQEQAMTGRPVVEKALDSATWQVTGRGNGPDVIEDVQSELTAKRVSGTDRIRLSFDNTNPATAAAGVNAVVDAYISEFKARDARNEAERKAKVEVGLAGVQAKIDALESKAKAVSQEFGVGDIDVLYDTTERRVTLLESKIIDVQTLSAVAAAVGVGRPASGPGAVQAGGPGTTNGAFKPLSVEELAAKDDLARQYLLEQSRLTGAIDDLRNARRLGAEHPEVRLLRQQLDRATERLDKYVAEYNSTQAVVARYPAAKGNSGGAAADGAGNGMRPEAVSADLSLINQLLEEAKAKLNTLAPKRQEARLYKAEASQMRVELAKLRGRQQTLELESLPTQGRVELIESGEISLKPYHDARPKFAAAAGLVGAGLPAMLVVLLGLHNRRYRFSDEAESHLSGSAPLLGILPALPPRLTDAEQASAAAQCLHQIRVMLQVGASGSAGSQPGRKRGVFLVTSATPGEGKTSLAVSLGLSFAAAGSRAIVIDCDIIGQRVTRGFNLQGVPGLRDALPAGTVRGFARKAACGLWVLPVGTADALDACAVSWGEMKRLLADARRYFDTIIIDSGPILGSVEATTVAPQCDGVIFTVSRGQQPPLVEKALRHLESIGAHVAGFVFNRAQAKDFSRSAHASSLRSISADGIPTISLFADGEATGRFGPLVQSVVSLLPSSRALVKPSGAGSAAVVTVG